MGQRIARGIFWFISVVIILLGIILSCLFFWVNRQMLLQTLLIILFGVVLNPIILDELGKRISVEIEYFKILAFVSIFLGATLALVIAYIIFSTTNNPGIDENQALQNFESILKIVVFLTYLGVLFVNKNANKNTKYVIFGIIYLICVLLSFASQSINYAIMNFLNIISGDLDVESYGMIINGILIPVREAILTYIIFDTIIGNEDKKKKINQLNSQGIIEYNSNTENVEENGKTFNVKVSDESSLEDFNYKIYINKRDINTSHRK